MSGRKYWFGIVAFGLLASPVSFAFEPQAVIYYTVPLGGQTKAQKKSRVGVQLDRARDQDFLRKRPLMDFRMDKDGLDSWKLKGITVVK